MHPTLISHVQYSLSSILISIVKSQLKPIFFYVSCLYCEVCVWIIYLFDAPASKEHFDDLFFHDHLIAKIPKKGVTSKQQEPTRSSLVFVHTSWCNKQPFLSQTDYPLDQPISLTIDITPYFARTVIGWCRNSPSQLKWNFHMPLKIWAWILLHLNSDPWGALRSSCLFFFSVSFFPPLHLK